MCSWDYERTKTCLGNRIPNALLDTSLCISIYWKYFYFMKLCQSRKQHTWGQTFSLRALGDHSYSSWGVGWCWIYFLVLIESLKKLWQQTEAEGCPDLPRPIAVQGRRTITEDSFQQKVTLISPGFYFLRVCKCHCDSRHVNATISVKRLYYMPRNLRRWKPPFWSC